MSNNNNKNKRQKQTTQTNNYSENGLFHYPNAQLDLHNLDLIVEHQLRTEKKLQSEANILSSLRPTKKPRLSGRVSPVLTVKFQEKHGTPKCIHLIALLDSGTSDTIMEEQFAKKLRTRESEATNWNTAAGNFNTNRRCKINMQLPEISPTMTITSDVHLTKSISPRYDMIIGRDMMKELGILLDFQNSLIQYGHMQVPMTDMDNLPSLVKVVADYNLMGTAPKSALSSNLRGPYQHGSLRTSPRSSEANFVTGILEPPTVAKAVEHVSKILDAKYAPVTPEQILDNSPHLSEEQKAGLKPILYKHLRLFDGTLGKWKGFQHKLELKDPKAKPFACRPYPVPVKNKATLMLEIERLCKIGVLRKVNNSEWQSPSTIIPKKDQTVRFITDFRKLNERIKRKPFLLPNIRDTLLELQGFEFGTSLDLNMDTITLNYILIPGSIVQLCFPLASTNTYAYQWAYVIVPTFSRNTCLT